MERVPLSDTEPDFGIAEAFKISEQAWRRAQEDRRAYLRDDTSETPRKMLDANRPVSVDDIYAMLNVYYWWQEDWEGPTDYLDDLFEDLTLEQTKQALRALHAAFPERCDYDYFATFLDCVRSKKACQNFDGWECFEKSQKKKGSKKPKKLKRDDLADQISLFFGMFEDTEGDNVLEDALRVYNRRKLGQAGLTELECDYSKEVLEIESDRREVYNAKFAGDLIEHMKRGGSTAEFFDKILPDIFAQDTDKLEYIVKAYDDIPHDWQAWDISKKIALARRYFAENRDYYMLMLTSYEWERYGVVPPYLYAMRPDNIFPGEI
jgi:hypothetical protein